MGHLPYYSYVPQKISQNVQDRWQVQQHSHSFSFLAYTALMNEPSRLKSVSRNASAGGATASAAAPSAEAAAAPPALAPGTLGCAHQFISSVVSAAVSALSPPRVAFLVPSCQKKHMFLQPQWQLAESKKKKELLQVIFNMVLI